MNPPEWHFQESAPGKYRFPGENHNCAMAFFLWLVKMPCFACPLFAEGASFCQDAESFLHFMQLCKYN